MAIVSPNKDDEIDDDFAELIVNKTNSIDQQQQRRGDDSSQDNQAMKMSELKQSSAAATEQ